MQSRDLELPERLKGAHYRLILRKETIETERNYWREYYALEKTIDAYWKHNELTTENKKRKARLYDTLDELECLARIKSINARVCLGMLTENFFVRTI